MPPSTPRMESAPPAPDVAALTAGPGAAVAANLESYLVVLPSVLFFQGPLALSMFLLGMAAARSGVLERRPDSSELRRIAIICLPIGLLAAGSQAYLLYYADRERFSVLAPG